VLHTSTLSTDLADPDAARTDGVAKVQPPAQRPRVGGTTCPTANITQVFVRLLGS